MTKLDINLKNKYFPNLTDSLFSRPPVSLPVLNEKLDSRRLNLLNRVLLKRVVKDPLFGRLSLSVAELCSFWFGRQHRITSVTLSFRLIGD